MVATNNKEAFPSSNSSAGSATGTDRRTRADRIGSLKPTPPNRTNLGQRKNGLSNSALAIATLSNNQQWSPSPPAFTPLSILQTSPILRTTHDVALDDGSLAEGTGETEEPDRRRPVRLGSGSTGSVVRVSTTSALLLLLACLSLTCSAKEPRNGGKKTCWPAEDGTVCAMIYGLEFDYSKAEELNMKKAGPNLMFWTTPTPPVFEIERYNNSPVIKEILDVTGVEAAPIISLVGDLTNLGKHFETGNVTLRWSTNFGLQGQSCNAAYDAQEVSTTKAYALDNNTHTMIYGDTGKAPFTVKSASLEYEPQQACLCVRSVQKYAECKFIGDKNTVFYLKKNIGMSQAYKAVIVVILLTLSGLFSGLNLGLMALDPNELKALKNVGDAQEKRYATKIEPVRKRGNFLLCTLLLGNTVVNATLAIFLGELFQGSIAVIASTFGIVTFGEIIPQSICSRHGLRVGAYTIIITKVFMVMTFPLSYPISKLLDLILGQEIGAVIKKKELLERIKLTHDHNDLEDDEMMMLQGALELSTKEVKSVMTKINDCFMLERSMNLDFKTIADIIETGYTRIPVYEDQRTSIQSLLFVKDLAFVDPDDETPLKVICDFYAHEVRYVAKNVKLDNLLEDFRKGAYHLAIVYDDEEFSERDGSENGEVSEVKKQKSLESNKDGISENGRKYAAIGIVTLEDVIEELIKGEIVDETDRFTDNRTFGINPFRHKIVDHKQLLPKLNKNKDGPGNDNDDPVITPQLLLAAHRFLCTEVQVFRFLRQDTVLKLIRQENVLMTLTDNDITRDPSRATLMKFNEVCNYFILILEGHCNVNVGQDSMTFDNGPFSYYGNKALQMCFATENPLTQSNGNLISLVQSPNNETVQSPLTNAITPTTTWQMRKDTIPDFIPDFTLTMSPDEDKLVYMRIDRDIFWKALTTDENAVNRMERAKEIVELHKTIDEVARTRTGTMNPVLPVAAGAGVAKNAVLPVTASPLNVTPSAVTAQLYQHAIHQQAVQRLRSRHNSSSENNLLNDVTREPLVKRDLQQVPDGSTEFASSNLDNV